VLVKGESWRLVALTASDVFGNGVCSYEVHVMQGPSCEGSLLLRIEDSVEGRKLAFLPPSLAPCSSGPVAIVG
jgi:hypothetical protein